MKRPGFFNGAFVALLLATLASIAITVLGPFYTFAQVIELVIPALALAYIVYLLTSSAERVGRVTVLALWCVFAATLAVLAVPPSLYILAHIGAIWLIRSLYFYSGILPAVMDCGLNVLSVAGALWAMHHTGSVFMSTWCFFLVQALYVAIPRSIRRPATKPGERDDFARAHRRAEAAVRQLLTHRTTST